jgi:hypothetical protein
LQQLREAIPSDHSYRFLLHDRDAIFSAEVDQQLKASAKSQHLVRKSKCGLGGQLGGSARFVLLGKLENLKSM